MSTVTSDNPSRSSSSGRSLRILIVEDNEDVAESMRTLLQLFKHEVAVAHTGAAALELAPAFLPDVVLCDIGLPDGMLGYDVAQALRKMPGFSQIYLVALTGYGRDEDRESALAAGFNVHLTKPIDFTELKALLVEVGS